MFWIADVFHSHTELLFSLSWQFNVLKTDMATAATLCGLFNDSVGLSHSIAVTDKMMNA
jgi:hypothetical protein